MVNINKDNVSIRIIIVGPEGAGRRWFLLSLPRAIAKYQDDSDFEYRLEEILDATDAHPLVSDVPSEEKMPDVFWMFSRIAKEKSTKHLVSSQMHRVNVVSMDTEDLHAVKISRNQDTQHYLFLLLDHTQLTDYGGEISKSVYREFVQEALDEIALAGSKNWSVAVCLTKGDLLENLKTGWGIIGQVFGENMVLLFKQNATRFKAIQPFRISAYGYYLDNGEIKPNPDPTVYDEVWQPEVEAPFFWTFENLEKDRLADVHWATKLFFQDQRLSEYVPYHVISLSQQNLVTKQGELIL